MVDLICENGYYNNSFTVRKREVVLGENPHGADKDEKTTTHENIGRFFAEKQRTARIKN